MIWHNGRLYMYDGWIQHKEWFGWITLRPARGFPGYVRLVEIGTDKVEMVRADTVMVGGEAF